MNDALTAATDTLCDTVRRAHAARTPLRIVGGGSKAFYGHPVTGELLSTRGLNGVVNYEPSELVITAGAGTLLADVEALLVTHGQSLPFEPPHFAPGGTLGGVIATGLSGPARASVGAVRDYVLGVHLVNGRGEHLQFGGQVMKNVAGYDVSRLVCGALGTLGVVTQISFKVLPVPPAERTLAFQCDEEQARKKLNQWGGQPLPLNASCWHDGRLLLRLRGAVAAVAAAEKALGGDAFTDQHAASAQWTLLRDHTHPFFICQPGEALWRVSVPDTAPNLNLGPTLVEWHGAQRWLRAPVSDGAHIRATAIAHGGHAILFNPGGAGTAQVPVFTPLSPPLAAITARLQAEFDPHGIFNVGRLGPSNLNHASKAH